MRTLKPIKLKPYNECSVNERRGAGIYLMVFPSGMKYVGRSKNILKRLNGHIYSFFNPRENDWHREGVKEFCPAAKNKDDVWKGFWRQVAFYIMPCEEGEEYELEDRALIEITINGKRNEYYNTAYPIKEEELLW